MTDEILKLNSNNELVAENPDTGETRPVKIGSLVAGGANIETDWYRQGVAAKVLAGNAGIVWVTELADGEELKVTQSGLTLDDGSAPPSGVDFIIGNLSTDSVAATLITGDGTLKADETGRPLGSYQNTTGSNEQIALMVDNGHFNSGTGDPQNVVASFIGRMI